MSDHYQVFISSTSLDNRKRREMVLEAIERAGRMVAVRMERFAADDRPTVEVCRRRAAECDLLLAIVAHRYGWEPKGQEKSVTWLEYEAAREAGRPCLVFEIEPDAPFTRADQDSGPDRWTKAEKLERFKARYAKDQLPAFFNDDNLGMLVQQALVQWRERREGAQAGPRASGKPPRLDAELRRYGEEALKVHGTLSLSGFKTKLRVPIDMKELYVPLRATSDLRGHGAAAFADARHAREELTKEGLVEEVSLLDAFRLAAKVKRDGVVILGEPGSGKTTHLKRLLISCLKEGPERLGLPAGMVPVFLPLRGLEDPDRETVDHFIARHLNEQLGLSSNFGKRLLERGRLLLLFDGLDEVANPERREKVARWVERVLRAHSSCRPVVTCRFAGYGEQGPNRSEVRLGAEFLELHIQPLNDQQAAAFVRKWYGLVESGLALDQEMAAKAAEKRAGDLIAQLRAGDMRTVRVAEMVGNPLLLANLCLVHRDHGRLPKDRRRLYDECVDVLLERWRERQGPLASMEVEQAKRALQPVAEWMHLEQGRTRASAAELEPVLAPVLKLIRWKSGGAKEFLSTVRDESGLLTGWGPDQFGFMHLGFQEYLTASELRRKAAEAGERQSTVLRSLARHYGESWWQEVLLLFVAMRNPSMFAPLMREVVKQPTFAESNDVLGLLLEEAAERVASPFEEVLHEAPGGGANLVGRQMRALEALALMGEVKTPGQRGSRLSPEILEMLRGWERPRLEVTEKGGVEIVSIQGGEFLMGSPPEEEGRSVLEGPQHQVRMSPFWIGRYPVTNEEYGRFLKENPRARTPQYWGDRSFNQAKQPVVGVTWDDASAFAEWVGGRLPREAEWEYACRAKTLTPRYAADLDAIAWYGSRNKSRGPRPVGQKKPNAWGLHDMLGNVWEWCGDGRRRYAPGPLLVDPQGPGGSIRVLRGGSWTSARNTVRAANREEHSVDYASGHVGFRLVLDKVASAKLPARGKSARRKAR